MSHHDDFDLDLSQAAETLHIPPGDVDAVVNRGRRRARRRRTAVATMTTVAVVAATVTGFGLLDRGDRGVPVAAGGGVRRGESGIRWERVSSSSALGFARTIEGTGPVYALSTAPGDVDPNPRNHSRVLWKSDDGVEWQSVSKLSDDLFLADLSSAGSRIYAVGTGPATAAVAGQRPAVDLIVGWSDDGGKTWRKAKLPLDMQAIAARTTLSGVRFTEVAAGAKGTVAVAVPYGALDMAKVLPAGVSAPNGWAITDDGVDLLGPRSSNPCPAGTSEHPPGEPKPAPAESPPPPTETPPPFRKAPPPPADVTATSGPPDGPDRPAAAAAVAQPTRAQPTTGEVHPTFCYRGEADPLELSPQQAQGVTRHYTWPELGVEKDLLAAVRGQAVAFTAEHGSSKFERVELSGGEGIYGPVTVGAGDDGFDLIGARWSGIDARLRRQPPPMAVLHSVDGREWTPGDLATPGLGSVTAAGQLGGRTTLIGQGDRDDPVLIRADGAGGWTSTPLGDVISRPAGSHLGVAGAAVGPFGVVAVVAVVPARAEEPSEMVPAPPEPGVAFRLLVSRDGVVWDDHPLDELAGGQVNGVGSVVVTSQQAVVTAILGQNRPGAGQKIQRATLVGTLD